jgi:hypothetical protein
MNKNDTVVVIAGIKDPDFDTDIGGWRGRVVSVDSDGTVALEWDSRTLTAMGLDAVKHAESEGLDWTQIVLLQSELKVAPPRDTEDDVKAAIKRIRSILD